MPWNSFPTTSQSAIAMNACQLISKETVVMTELSISHPFLLPHWCPSFFCLKQWNPFLKKSHVDLQYIKQIKVDMNFLSACPSRFFYINPFLKLKDTAPFPETLLLHPTCPSSICVNSGSVGRSQLA